MSEMTKTDDGSVKVHKRVLAEVVRSAVDGVNGVQLIPPDFIVSVGNLLGLRRTPGVAIRIGRNNQVSIEIKIMIQVAMSIPDTAKIVQEAVREAVEKAMDMELKDINVDVQGIVKQGT